MDALYWILEYGKVFCGYLFLMFIWPSAVFRGCLKKKTAAFCFGFCVTVPVVILHTAVLTLGFLHLLDRRIIVLIFYGAYAAALVKNRPVLTEAGTGYRAVSFLKKYGLLMAVLVFGIICFSYGAFQVHSYGYGDLYVHHEWIYGLVKGRIYAGGVYPEGMHCFVYGMHVLFGIRIYSILLFLQGIHVAVFLVSGWLLLRRILYWRYMPELVLTLFLVLDPGRNNADLIHSIFRLQITMPMEFGLHTVFLCALFLSRYVHEGRREDLFLSAMSLSACITIHFHALLMLFLVCTVFGVSAWKKLLCRKRLVPLLLAGLCAGVVAAAPMAGALMQGIVPNGSIAWAADCMAGRTDSGFRPVQHDSEEGQDGKAAQTSTAASVLRFLIRIYEEGPVALYGPRRACRISFLTVLAAVFCLKTGRKFRFRYLRKIRAGYPPAVLLSVLYVMVYAAPAVGLPDLLPEGRFFAVGHMLLLSIMAMPADLFFSVLSRFCSAHVMQIVSFAAAAGIYGGAVASGCFRGHLFYELTRYDAAVQVTNSIMDTCLPYSYTIVSPTDELLQIISCGWHEELLSFVEKCTVRGYTIPSEYVFLYIEKKPLLYAQAHFFTGPAWLGEEKYEIPYQKACQAKDPDCTVSRSPGILASRISKKAAESALPKLYDPWQLYVQPDTRTILESRAYEWCRRFSERYPSALRVYYEDDDFVCYYFRQDTDQALYDLGPEDSPESVGSGKTADKF